MKPDDPRSIRFMRARAASASSTERQIARVAPPGRYANVLNILVGPNAMTSAVPAETEIADRRSRPANRLVCTGAG